VSTSNLNVTLTVASSDFITSFQQHGSTDFSKSFQRQEIYHCKHPGAMNLAMERVWILTTVMLSAWQ